MAGKGEEEAKSNVSAIEVDRQTRKVATVQEPGRKVIIMGKTERRKRNSVKKILL